MHILVFVGRDLCLPYAYGNKKWNHETKLDLYLFSVWKKTPSIQRSRSTLVI